MTMTTITAPTNTAPTITVPPAPAAPAEAAQVVAALRDRFADVIAVEMARLNSRVDLDPHTREEVTAAAHRAAHTLFGPACERVLHEAASPTGAWYAHALAQVCALDVAEAGR
ncbi:hypothetical protein ACWDRB_47680 [Nonomuraea sp. NPDC003707]